MTPPAITPAGARATRSTTRPEARPTGRAGARKTTARKTTPRTTQRVGTRTAGEPPHNRTVRRRPASRAPRRVSGPLRPGATAIPRRLRLPARSATRRISVDSLSARAAAFVRGLPDHPLLDRMVRGRTWIVLLGVLLAGIVATQVEMLKLGASIGRSIQLGTALQSRNELLRASVSSLSDDRRIERLASGMGMVMPGPTSLGFLDAGRTNVGAAAANIHAPSASSFEAALQAMNAAATSSVGVTPIPGAVPGAPTGTGTLASTGTPVATSTPTVTSTPATTGTGTPAATVTPTGTGAATATGAPTLTGTPTPTATPTPTSTPMDTPTGGAAPGAAPAASPTTGNQTPAGG